MNTDIIKGTWEEAKGKIKQQWGKLTDDDLKVIEGNYDELYGKLQKRYGYTKEEAKQKVEQAKL